MNTDDHNAEVIVAPPGEHVNDTAGRTCEIAHLRQRAVVMHHNGTRVLVGPNDRVSDIVAMWYKRRPV